MLAWILEYCGFKPGFLIGGIPLNFNVSARLGDSAFFVVEADEYDCAFFDKRSKFIHYHPRTAIFNNLEYDHADIFPDLEAIKQQFHYLVRTIPSGGLIISPVNEQAIDDVLAMGCWTRLTKTAIGKNVQWNAQLRHADGSEFAVFFQGQEQGVIQWALTGEHNVYNALAAIAAAKHVGINPEDAVMALHQFKNAKRRMEVLARIGNVTVYDDFAHHPTAIATTLDGLRKRVWQDRIIAVVEPRSNTMRLGVHADKLAEALQQADLAIIYAPNNLGWNAHALANQADNIVIYSTIDDIIERLKIEATQEDGGHFVLMSNGDFGGIYQRLQSALTEIL
jgi:UDP-N-acetylmuramate: L-alanyl-gamma-D-glutamyl-meso-diaminopimelate ligase